MTKSDFFSGLAENNRELLLKVPMSDIHNHSTKGCRRSWLAEQLNMVLPEPPEKFDGLSGMQEWFTKEIKPYCTGKEESYSGGKVLLPRRKETTSQGLR